jgi:hypothetical protein
MEPTLVYSIVSLQTKVRLQQVVLPNLSQVLIAEESDSRHPNGCDKRSARTFAARRINKQQHEEILDQLTCRAIIEYHEEVHG